QAPAAAAPAAASAKSARPNDPNAKKTMLALLKKARSLGASDLHLSCGSKPFLRLHGGLQYLNADITFYIHRYPDGEWVGFETIDHQATDGIAFGSCRLYDEVGPIGTSAVTALHTPRED
ncbi:MAG: thioesterase family protein, partial [Candidatus Hydrogenedentes bacterium]|nr:thioesterase family protein [Candidatus Hydrogenedentota bacterium]